MRRRTIAVTTLALAIQALGPISPARAAEPVAASFFPTGDEQFFDVPAGVTSVHVVLIGGRGGVGASGPAGGFGARVEGDLEVTPGQTIYVEVGGNGGTGVPGFNGGGEGPGSFTGGGGGGASDLRSVSRTEAGSLTSRLVVSGGGGGSGASGGAGGNAGQPGASSAAAGGGGAGTTTAGGTGGLGSNGLVGGDGSLGQGGAGGDGGASFPSGGGGGGGLYGGGGGGPSGFGGGGAGGGSSFTGSATSATVVVDDSGVPSVTITYVPTVGASSGTVDAVVTMAASAVCLELSTTAIDFGTRQFGEVGAIATPGVGITNCGGVTESILARGTDATGAGPVTWSLVDTGNCAGGTLGLDDYRLTLVDPNTFGETPLTTTNQALFTLAGGATANRSAAIDTPCPGSSGAGTVMSMQITFVATE